MVSDRAELSNFVKEVPLPLERETLWLNYGGHVVLVNLYPILDEFVLFLIGVAMVLGDDHAWHAGAYLEVVGRLDLWELLEERCEETGPVVHRYYHLSITVDHQLSRVTAG